MSDPAPNSRAFFELISTIKEGISELKRDTEKDLDGVKGEIKSLREDYACLVKKISVIIKEVEMNNKTKTARRAILLGLFGGAIPTTIMLIYTVWGG